MMERIINFGRMKPLPEGWSVIQLDSGHYMATNGNRESAITVNRYHARRWAFQLAGEWMTPCDVEGHILG